MQTLEQLTQPYTLRVPGSTPVEVRITPDPRDDLSVIVELDGDDGGRSYTPRGMVAGVADHSDPGIREVWRRLAERAERVIAAARRDREVRAEQHRAERAGVSLAEARQLRARLGHWVTADAGRAWERVRDYARTAMGGWGRTEQAWRAWRDHPASRKVDIDHAIRALYVLEPEALSSDRRELIERA